MPVHPICSAIAQFRHVGLATLFVVAASPAHAQDRPWLDSARAQLIVDRARSAFPSVGLAVSVVQDGRVVYRHVSGERRVGSGEPLTPQTPLPIASVTKAFTATALAVAVEQRRLQWEDPVVRHLPAFRMADPYVTRSLTVRDLLVHRSGLALGAGDLLTWPDARWTPADVLAALPHLPLEHGFRDRYVYDNTLYIVAGELLRAVAGADWATTLRTSVLAPLGLRDCAPRPSARPDRAAQHGRTAGTAPRALPEGFDAADPAGSMVCSLEALETWAQFHLGDGRLADGTALLRDASMRELHTPVTLMRVNGMQRRLGGTHLSGYALGWIAADFHGQLLLSHGGAAPGALTELLLLPESRAAVIVHVNDQVPLPFLLSRELADAIVRGPHHADWIADAQRRAPAGAPRDAAGTDSLRIDPTAALPATLAAHVGRYEDPWYGAITIDRDDHGLRLHLTRSTALRGPLVPLGGARFLARWPDRTLDADAILTFVYDATGTPCGFTMRAASARTDFSYDFHHLRPTRPRTGEQPACPLPP